MAQRRQIMIKILAVLPPAFPERSLVYMRLSISAKIKVVIWFSIEVSTHAFRLTFVELWSFHFHIISPTVPFYSHHCARGKPDLITPKQQLMASLLYVKLLQGIIEVLSITLDWKITSINTTTMKLRRLDYCLTLTTFGCV